MAVPGGFFIYSLVFPALLCASASIAVAASPARLLGKQFAEQLTRLENDNSSTRFRVLLRLKDCEDASPGGPGKTVALLRKRCELSASKLPGLSEEGADVRRLWIVNATAASLRAATLLEIAGRGEVQSISRVRMFSAMPGPLPAPDGDRPAPDTLDRRPPFMQLLVDKVREKYGFTGKGVVLGQIDTGVDTTHPSLRNAVGTWRDFVDGKSSPADPESHGTHTAGLMVGSDTGIAPDARLIAARALDKNGQGSLETLLAAMQWMLDPDGNPDTDDFPVAVNNSWGIATVILQAAEIDQRMFWEAVQAWRKAGIIPVFSIGNGGYGNQCVPGSYPMVLSVGAVDYSFHVAPFSASGTVSWGGRGYMRPDLVAPGVKIRSCLPGGRYGTMSGTSQAAPLVTGLIALIVQANPGLERHAIERILLDSTLDLGAPGRDEFYGEGLPNALRAVETALAMKDPPRDGTPR